jgi:hypothetical protein
VSAEATTDDPPTRAFVLPLCPPSFPLRDGNVAAVAALPNTLAAPTSNARRPIFPVVPFFRVGSELQSMAIANPPFFQPQLAEHFSAASQYTFRRRTFDTQTE